jgi:DNA repair protein SbcC/Rad50
MRPRSLHLRGFTAFRSMEEPVSFLDADLFALTGPTGSGKTSLLDAMCFALYGRVPRLDARAVEPVISLGAQEARIGFEFSVGDRIFTAARVVRRTKTGATTPEARLEERIDEVNEVRASGADEVNESVTALLGLSFDQFTKAVLLPQGAFATFLHDTPAKRQDLLRTLLDLGLYERMRELAQLRKARAEGEAEALDRDVARLTDATEEAQVQAELRLTTVTRLLESVREAQPEVEALSTALSEIDTGVVSLGSTLTALESVVVPEDVAGIARSMDEAMAALVQADAVVARAGEAVETAEKELVTLPGLQDLVTARHRWQRRAELVDRVERGRTITEEASVRHEVAVTALVEADRVADDAVAALAALESRHQGHALAVGLTVGAECPVCLRVIDSLELGPPPEGLEAARSRHIEAAAAQRSAADEVAAAAAHLASCRSTLETLVAELANVDGSLQGQPSANEVDEAHARVERAHSELADLRAAERAARQAADASRAAMAAARDGEAAGRRALSAARDRVASAGPPELGMGDLASEWVRLDEWAMQCRQALAVEQAALVERRSVIAGQLAAVQAALDDQLAAAGLPSNGTQLEQVLRAHADAGHRLDRVKEDRERAAATLERAKAARSEADLAKGLARHLQANGFEGWLMEEALEALVLGANRLLAELSGGTYSLRMDKRDFSVVDHRNADETRGVKTLSGGETFLVSLALALSLADQIGSLAGDGAVRLESMFLDEGFGTLDAETLDVVAGVIQELGATGRTVGLVTHVKELAELVPVRYEITRLPGGSVVERVDA